MSPRARFLSTGASAVAASVVVALSLLTALHHLLDTPALNHFDNVIQNAIHQPTTPPLTSLMLAFTWLGAIKIFAPALAVAILWLAYQGRTREAALLGSGIAGAFLLNEALKLHFHRPRPQLPWSIGDEHTYSFPSGHSLFAVVLYGALAYLALRQPGPRRLIILPAILMPLTIGLSRIYLGMHYLTDVLAGWLAGACWLTALLVIDRAWSAQAAVAPRQLKHPPTPTHQHPSNSGPSAQP